MTVAEALSEVLEQELGLVLGDGEDALDEPLEPRLALDHEVVTGQVRAPDDAVRVGA